MCSNVLLCVRLSFGLSTDWSSNEVRKIAIYLCSDTLILDQGKRDQTQQPADKKSCVFPDSLSCKLALGNTHIDFSESLAWRHPPSKDEGLTIPASLTPGISEKDVFANAREVSRKISLCLFLHSNIFRKIKPHEGLCNGSQLASLKRKCRVMCATHSAKRPGADNFACRANRNGVSRAEMQQLGWSY